MIVMDESVIERRFKFEKGKYSSFSRDSEQKILEKLGPIGESKLPPSKLGGSFPVFRSAILSMERDDLVKELKNLNKTMILLLELILEMALSFTHRLEVEMKYLHFSQNWLSERLGVSREWISKCLVRLEKLGYLKIFRSRDKSGKFRVNVYLPSRKLIELTNLSRRAKKMLNTVYGIISNIMRGLTKYKTLEHLINGYRIAYYRYWKSKKGGYPSLVLFGIRSYLADESELVHSLDVIEDVLSRLESEEVVVLRG